MRSENKSTPNIWLRTLRSAVIACAFSTLMTLVFAFVLQKQWLEPESVRFINPAVKIASSVVAALFALRRAPDRAMLRGALAGGFYMALAFVVFSLIAGSFAFRTALLTDLAMCILCGAIVGMVKNLLR